MRRIWMRAEARSLNGLNNKKAVVVVSAEGWRRKTNAKVTLRSSSQRRPCAAPIIVSYNASRTRPGNRGHSCPALAAFLPSVLLALLLMAASSSSQPDLLIGRGGLPLNSQQPSGHRLVRIHIKPVPAILEVKNLRTRDRLMSADSPSQFGLMPMPIEATPGFGRPNSGISLMRFRLSDLMRPRDLQARKLSGWKVSRQSPLMLKSVEI
jgi:hypothetical protein